MPKTPQKDRFSANFGNGMLRIGDAHYFGVLRHFGCKQPLATPRKSRYTSSITLKLYQPVLRVFLFIGYGEQERDENWILTDILYL